MTNIKSYFKLQLDPFIKVLLWGLKTYLEEKIETHKENVKWHDRKRKEYETKIKSYDRKMLDYKSARRKQETMLDKQENSTSDQVTETCDATKIVLQIMTAFTTQVEEVKCRISSKYNKIKEHERQIYRLESNIRYTNENNPDRLKDFLTNMDKDLTTALNEWELDKNALKTNIEEWENMVEKVRQDVAVQCQGRINKMRDRAKMNTTQLIVNGAGTLGGKGAGVVALGTPGGGLAAGANFGLGGYFGKRSKDQIGSSTMSKNITTAAEDAVKALRS